ncbi:tetratricopeptide repeat protein [Patescibacteria group bacterium]|nr:tetratricopeptide repeat protein [Patescibacteria group bacterium]
MFELIIIISLAIIFFIFLARMPEVEKISKKEASGLKIFFAKILSSFKDIRFKPKRRSFPILKKTKDLSLEAEKKLKVGDLEAAEKLYLRLAVVSPKEAKIYASLGRIYLERLNFKDAIASFKAAVSRDQKNGFYYYDLARALFRAERYTEAITCFEKSILINNRIPSRHFDLGLTLLKIKEYKRAADSFRRAYEIEPNNEKYKRLLKKVEEKISYKVLN